MRTIPDFNHDSSRKQSNDNDSPSCLWMFVISVGGYFVYTAVSRVTSGNGSRLDQMICYGVLIGVVLLVIVAKWQEAQDGVRQEEARQIWKSTCKSEEVAIVHRHYSPGGYYEDEYEIPHRSRPSYRVVLALTDEQKLVYPNLTSISVDVNECTYSKLSDQTMVRVYYQPEAPMVFLLEEEMG